MAMDCESGNQGRLLGRCAVPVKPAQAGQTFAPAVRLLLLSGEECEKGDRHQAYYQEGWKNLIDGHASKHPS